MSMASVAVQQSNAVAAAQAAATANATNGTSSSGTTSAGSTTGNMPFLTQLLRKISPKLGAMAARNP